MQAQTAAFKEVGKSVRNRKGKRRGRRRERSSSASRSSESPFRLARRAKHGIAVVEMARRTPGALLKSALTMVRDYLVMAQGSDPSANANLSAMVVSYLTTVFLPARGAALGLRDVQELRTLARALDLILRGNLASAADHLIQRFKAVESAATDGWAVAQHLEFIPAGTVTSVERRVRDYAIVAEKNEAKMRALMRSGVEDRRPRAPMRRE